VLVAILLTCCYSRVCKRWRSLIRRPRVLDDGSDETELTFSEYKSLYYDNKRFYRLFYDQLTIFTLESSAPATVREGANFQVRCQNPAHSGRKLIMQIHHVRGDQVLLSCEDHHWSILDTSTGILRRFPRAPDTPRSPPTLSDNNKVFFPHTWAAPGLNLIDMNTGSSRPLVPCAYATEVFGSISKVHVWRNRMIWQLHGHPPKKSIVTLSDVDLSHDPPRCVAVSNFPQTLILAANEDWVVMCDYETENKPAIFSLNLDTERELEFDFWDDVFYMSWSICGCLALGASEQSFAIFSLVNGDALWQMDHQIKPGMEPQWVLENDRIVVLYSRIHSKHPTSIFAWDVTKPPSSPRRISHQQPQLQHSHQPHQLQPLQHQQHNGQ
jgi:hypothetical protein